MGYGTVIAGLVVVGMIIISAHITFQSEFDTATTIADNTRNIREVSYNIAKMQLTVTSANIINGTDTVAVTVENDGNEKILLSDYDNIDVISQYTSSGSTYANWNKYTSSDVASLNANEWTNVSIFPDSINPGIFDPGEELDIMIKIPGVGSADTCWIQVTTPYGKSSAQMATIP